MPESQPPTNFAEAMADQLTHCYASTVGCKRFPVRLIYEKEPDGTLSMVCLCPDHATTYQPDGEIISDTMLVEGENLELVKKITW